ncbi:MAG: hypothetical protein WAO77_09380, partial [Sphingobium sp.]|uniref:hypothetical protein n=1 Tax=Sphingobium sp. TaxID=1912891 RepID=UPI003BAE2586
MAPTEVAICDEAGVYLNETFVVTLSSSGTGGTVTFPSAPTTESLPPFLIVSAPDFGVAVSLGSTSAFNPRTLNPSFERLAVQNIHLKQGLDSSLRLPPGELGSLLPPAAERAGGNKIFAPHPVTGEMMILPGGAFRGDKGDKGEPGDQDGNALVWLDAFIEEGDLSDSDAFQRCHDYLAERIDFGETSIITVMLGSRTYHLGSAVLIDKVPMRFIGRGCAIGVAPGMGTWLTISDDSFTPFTITLGSQETRGCGFWNIGIYQIGHPPVAPGWAPKDFPHIFDVQSLLGEFTLDHIYAVNINKLVNCDLSGRLNIDNLRGMIFTNV